MGLRIILIQSGNHLNRNRRALKKCGYTQIRPLISPVPDGGLGKKISMSKISIDHTFILDLIFSKR